MVFIVAEVDTIYLSKKGRNTGNKFDILVYKFATFKENKQMTKTSNLTTVRIHNAIMYT